MADPLGQERGRRWAGLQVLCLPKSSCKGSFLKRYPETYCRLWILKITRTHPSEWLKPGQTDLTWWRAGEDAGKRGPTLCGWVYRGAATLNTHTSLLSHPEASPQAKQMCLHKNAHRHSSICNRPEPETNPMSIDWWAQPPRGGRPHDGILLGNEKGPAPDTHNDMNESQSSYAWRIKPHKKGHGVCFLFICVKS